MDIDLYIYNIAIYFKIILFIMFNKVVKRVMHNINLQGYKYSKKNKPKVQIEYEQEHNKNDD